MSARALVFAGIVVFGFARPAAALTSTTATLVVSANPVLSNQSVTLTVMVVGVGGPPTGSVTFYDGLTQLSTGTLNGGGQAAISSTFSLGAHPFTAIYSGSVTFATSTSNTVNLSVVDSTTTSLIANVNPIDYGAPVTLTAVVASDSETPTGTVSFSASGLSLGTAALDSTGTATLVTSDVPSGVSTVSATFSPLGSFNASTANLFLTVESDPTLTTLTASSETIAVGDTVGLSVLVSQLVEGQSSPATGTVRIFDGATTGTPLTTLGLSGGEADFLASGLSVGTHWLTAVYPASSTSTTSQSPAVAVIVGLATSTTALQAAPDPVSAAATVVLTATVSSPAGVSSAGTVTFADDFVPIGSSTVTAGTASLNTSFATAGTHLLTATFNGNSVLATSTSATLGVAVMALDAGPTTDAGPALTSISLIASPDPAIAGDSALVTVTVGAAIGSPSGNVLLFDGAAGVGQAALDGLGQASFVLEDLTLATHVLTATFGGNAQFSASASSPFDLEVAPGPTAPPPSATLTSLIASPDPAIAGDSALVTVTVGAATGIPNGDVSLFDGDAGQGQAALDGLGQAAFVLTNLTAQTHVLTAAYGGSASFSSSVSGPLELQVTTSGTVTPPQPSPTVASLSVTPDPAYTNGGSTVTVTVGSAAGTPNGGVALFDGDAGQGQAALDGLGQATFALTNLSVGTHVLTAGYLGTPSFSASTSGPVDLEVLPPAATGAQALQVTVSPAVASIASGSSVQFGVSVSGPLATAQGLNFFCAGLPPASACTFGSTQDAGGSETATLTINTAQASAQRDVHPSLGYWALALPALAWSSRRRRRDLAAVLLVGAALAAGQLVACGQSNPGTADAGGTPPGQYVISVTAYSGDIQGVSYVTLNVH